MAARFVDVSESEIDQFKENAVPQKTKESTNHQCNSTKTVKGRGHFQDMNSKHFFSL